MCCTACAGEYERDCREEEQEASARFYREQREVRQQRREELRQAEAAELASRAEATRRAEQCTESRRILAAKRARTDLTDGEQKDLKRFEEVFCNALSALTGAAPEAGCPYSGCAPW